MSVHLAESFDNSAIICGNVCPLLKVQDASAFDLLRQYKKGLYTTREIINKPAGLMIASCVDMRESGDCLFTKD